MYLKIAGILLSRFKSFQEILLGFRNLLKL